MSDEPPLIPQSAPPIIPKKSRSSVGGKVALFLVFAFCGFIAFRLVQFAIYMHAHPRAHSPGQAAFLEANRLIITGHGQTGLGNTPEAIAVAEAYSAKLKSLREQFFTKGEPDHDLFAVLAKGDFPTFCQLNSNACVILVHVPELRRFTDEARQSLGQIAWQTAQETVKEKLASPPPQLVVGVKGELWYDSILIGKFVPTPREVGEGIQIRTSGIREMELFYPFFAPDGDAARAEEAEP